MKHKLIADAGSTKVEWLLTDDSGELIGRSVEHGLNAVTASAEEIAENFRTLSAKLGITITPSEIHYYGAGCATPAICAKLHGALTDVWHAGIIHVESDLLGAARALFGEERGIACILGTGSNSGLYNGSRIERNVPPLGFILGDEGSGAALGKRLVADAFKGHLPAPIREKFMEYYELTLDNIFEYTYRRPGANRFLASLVPFIKDHIWNPYLYSLVLEEFTTFFKRNVAMYQGARSLPVSFIGSVAFHFSDILREAADRQGFSVATITKSPAEGLLRFHHPSPLSFSTQPEKS